MIAAIGMGVGAAVWLVFELYAVFSGEHPTTWYVRTYQKKWIVVRILVILFLVWLGLHFEAGLP